MSGDSCRKQQAHSYLRLLFAWIREAVCYLFQQAAVDSVVEEEVRHLLGGGQDGTDFALTQGGKHLIRFIGKIAKQKGRTT